MKVSKNRLALIAAEGIIANLMLGTLFVWSMLRNPLLELFPSWTEGMLSVIFGIHNLFTCLGIISGGLLRKRLSARKCMVIFAGLMAVGLGGFALLPVDRAGLSYVLAFILFCGFAATGIGLGISTVQSTTIPWFPNHSGAISGALYMTLGASSVALAALARPIIEHMSVLMVLPCFGAMIVILTGLLLCDRQSFLEPELEKSGSESGMGPRDMLRSGTFIVLLIWNIMLRTSGLTLVDHASSMAVYYGGSALVAMLIAPANGLGSMMIGITLDRLGTRRIAYIEAGLTLLAALLLLSGCMRGSFPLIFAALIIGGFAYGGSNSSYAGCIKMNFGGMHYVQNFALSNIAVGISALIEACSGTVLDIFGSYSAVAAMVLVMAVISMAMALGGQKKLK